MSRPTCPTCTKPIDPTHAPVARIRGAKIVTFCSATCAEGQAAPPPPSEPAAAKSIRKRKKSSTLDDAWGEPSAALASPAVEQESPSVAAAKPVAVSANEPAPLSLKKSRSPRRKGLIVALAALACGGAALAIFDAVGAKGSGESEARVAASEVAGLAAAPSSSALASASVAAENASEKQSEVTPELLYERAVAALTELRSSPSRRIKRLSTMALARAGDKDALVGLRELLATEESSLNQIDLAYALARAGDAKGRETLVAGLGHARRDVRIDASIALLNLGDDAGRETLSRMTNLRHYKISACEHLARAGDESAKQLLEKVYADKNEDPETVLRAAVALGRAGDASVADYLRSTLADGRFQVGAADALAALGDKAAVEPLIGQLELNAMRVRAAIALRRLGAEVSLEPLGVALTEDDEVTRVTAAEATLILTGPAELAARD